MLELFFTKFVETVFTEAGVVAISFLFGLIYQTRQLNASRKENKTLNEQILQLATSQIAANKEVQKVLEMVVHAMPSTGGNNA